jgi:hypothetical protein
VAEDGGEARGGGGGGPAVGGEVGVGCGAHVVQCWCDCKWTTVWNYFQKRRRNEVEGKKSQRVPRREHMRL